MLSVIMQTVVLLTVIYPNYYFFSTMRAVILTVFMLGVIMLNAQLSCGLFKKNMTIINDDHE
jgi:hypothetical protein